MLEKDPNIRITADEALKHNYFEGLDPISSKEIDFGELISSEED